MYKKVIFGATCRTEDGIILGKEIGGFNGKRFFNDMDDNESCATYGTINESGEFQEFCSFEGYECGFSCRNASSPACRYNRKTQSTAGYYVYVK